MIPPRKVAGLAEWGRWFVLAFLVLNAIYWFAMWRMTMWPTDFYGRPVTYWQDLRKGIEQHPEWLVFSNWGPIFSGGLLPPVLFLAFAFGILQRTNFWRGRSWFRPIDAPLSYLIVVTPLCLLFLAVVGVGANRAGFGFEMTIPVRVTGGRVEVVRNYNASDPTIQLIEVGNHIYGGLSHYSSAFLLMAPIVPFDVEGALGWKERYKWILLLCIMVALYAFWETKENKHMREIGGPRMSDQNAQDDSDWDMAMMLLGWSTPLVIYHLTWDHEHPEDFDPKRDSWMAKYQDVQ